MLPVVWSLCPLLTQLSSGGLLGGRANQPPNSTVPFLQLHFENSKVVFRVGDGRIETSARRQSSGNEKIT